MHGVCGLAFFWWGAMAWGGEPRVSFLPPPGSTVLAVSGAEQARIRRIIQDKLIALEGLSGVPARPVAVQVFATSDEFVTFTQVPPDYGAVTRDGVIMMQPLSMLDRHRGLRRILEHEAVHHHFFRVGRDWPRNFHEALAHYLSGGRIAVSPRANELGRRPRNGEEESEYEAHLASQLDSMVKGVGMKAFLRRLVRGEIDLSAFHRPRSWFSASP